MATIGTGSVDTARQARKVRLSSGWAAASSTLGQLTPSRSPSAWRAAVADTSTAARRAPRWRSRAQTGVVASGR
jgi:hypothetical protein